jgi:hypothetical protein
MRATSTHRLSRKKPNHSTLDNPNSMRRTASASRPYRPLRGRAPPEPGPRRLIVAPNYRVEGKKKGRPSLLTGPAPSGMTCRFGGAEGIRTPDLLIAKVRLAPPATCATASVRCTACPDKPESPTRGPPGGHSRTTDPLALFTAAGRTRPRANSDLSVCFYTAAERPECGSAYGDGRGRLEHARRA